MSGFQINEPIKFFLEDLSMIQLIDVPKDVTLEEKICGLNRAFFAPEVIEGGTAE